MMFTEAKFENAVIEVFRDTLGYSYVYAPDLTRDDIVNNTLHEFLKPPILVSFPRNIFFF